MKKIVLSLIALGAISGAAFAAADDYDNEGLAAQLAGDRASGGASLVQAIDSQTGLTAFEKARMDAKMDLSDR